MKNRTFCIGDNLDYIKEIDDESIDLVYADPPFNKKRKFRSPLGSKAARSEFKDIWKPTIDDKFYNQVNKGQCSADLNRICQSIITTHSESMANYIITGVYQWAKEIHRVLKPTGSLYFHNDARAGHYTKQMLDYVFGKNNFLNDIIWWYRGTSCSSKQYLRKHDNIFFYAKKQGKNTFNPERVPTSGGRVSNWTGLDTKLCDDTWKISTAFIQNRNTHTGYPTEKPEKLLKRIIEVSSNEGDILLDPFAGSGVSLAMAEILGRRWIGMDFSRRSYEVSCERLRVPFAVSKQRGQRIIERCEHEKPHSSDADYIDEDLEEYLYRQQRGKCKDCKKSLDQGYDIDHIVPVKDLGGDGITNLHILCKPCHKIKTNKERIKYHCRGYKNGGLLEFDDE